MQDVRIEWWGMLNVRIGNNFTKNNNHAKCQDKHARREDRYAKCQ